MERRIERVPVRRADLDGKEANVLALMVAGADHDVIEDLVYGGEIVPEEYREAFDELRGR